MKVLAFVTPGQQGEVDVSGSLPFFLADASQADIALTTNYALPFFMSDGTEADIAMTT